MHRFSFSDLHSFKDYVVFVQMSLATHFPRRGPLAPKWTPKLAFQGLQLGLDMAIEEKGPLPLFENCRHLVAEAEAANNAGRQADCYDKLGEMSRLIDTVPT